MRRAIAMGMVLAIVATIIAALPVNVQAPAPAANLTPKQGKVGSAAVIHGSGFSAGIVVVKFGRALAQNVQTVNNQTVKLTIPNRCALDPNPVKVTVTIDNVLMGESEFYYDPSGQEPVITGFEPSKATLFMPIEVTITGTHFTTSSGRIPDQIFLVGPETIQGIIIGSPTDTSFTAEFLEAKLPGVYELVVGFSDGAGAFAEGFEVTAT